jgi:ornithine cyclodeaminase/alanine dehydrogenase-like protein (mu-crystallin family)
MKPTDSSDPTHPTVRVLSADDVRKALPMAEAVEAMKEAFADLSAGRAKAPLRAHIEVPEQQGSTLFMPSYIAGEKILGVKVVSIYDRNPDRGLPRTQAVMMVLDAADGSPRAILEAGALTAIRTGAASGAATDLLARPDAETAAVFGAGVQGRTQLEAVCAVRSIRKARIFDALRENAENFAREMSAALDCDVEPAGTPAQAVEGADVICTATNAREPVFADGDLAEGAHINAVGSYQPEVREIPGETVARARVVVDHRESALAETGDLIIPIGQGLISEDHIHAELGEIVLGERTGRTSPVEVTLFKSVGTAVQDLTAAARILARAEQADLGAEVRL